MFLKISESLIILTLLLESFSDASQSARRKAARGMPTILYVYSVGKTTIRGICHLFENKSSLLFMCLP
jgi:hypothetical protein